MKVKVQNKKLRADLFLRDGGQLQSWKESEKNKVLQGYKDYNFSHKCIKSLN